ncbi:MAG TPA: TIGR03936 family radical SAM-associated protein [Bacillota bacterium]|nr:TIGR03936 family radical SAM-associated protein [Bacillota bacterium]
MRYRIEFQRLPEARFVSHLDTMKTVERAARRAGIPLAFSEGFNPHPKISFGSALAVGVTSDQEYLEIELSEDWEPAQLIKQLNQGLPSGYRLLQGRRLAENSPAAMSVINRADYLVRARLGRKITLDELKQLAIEFMAREEIKVVKNTKKGKREVDLRPGIYQLAVDLQEDYLILRLLLQAGSTGNIRPEDVLNGLSQMGDLGIDIISARIHRLGLAATGDAKRKSPLDI